MDIKAHFDTAWFINNMCSILWYQHWSILSVLSFYDTKDLCHFSFFYIKYRDMKALYLALVITKILFTPVLINVHLFFTCSVSNMWLAVYVPLSKGMPQCNFIMRRTSIMLAQICVLGFCTKPCKIELNNEFVYKKIILTGNRQHLSTAHNSFA